MPKNLCFWEVPSASCKSKSRSQALFFSSFFFFFFVCFLLSRLFSPSRMLMHASHLALISLKFNEASLAFGFPTLHLSLFPLSPSLSLWLRLWLSQCFVRHGGDNSRVKKDNSARWKPEEMLGTTHFDTRLCAVWILMCRDSVSEIAIGPPAN